MNADKHGYNALESAFISVHRWFKNPVLGDGHWIASGQHFVTHDSEPPLFLTIRHFS